MKTTSRVAHPKPDDAPSSASPSSPMTAGIVRQLGTYRRAEHNIVESASLAGTFQTFGTAIQIAGLVDTLSGKGPFTVFAPTDAAFAKMPKADLDTLLQDTARLRQILIHHVASHIVAAPKEGSPKPAKMLDGSKLQITAKNHGFMVDEAIVVNSEVVASNGVIHAIDTVLLPR